MGHKPHTKQITNRNHNHRDHPTRRTPLKRPTHSQSPHTPRLRTANTRNEENAIRYQDYRFPTEDVGQFGPDGSGCGAGEEIGAADPDVAGGAGEVVRYGRDGGCDDCLVEGRYEH